MYWERWGIGGNIDTTEYYNNNWHEGDQSMSQPTLCNQNTQGLASSAVDTNWASDTAKMVAGWMLLTTVTLVYAAVCMDGEEQARLALVLAGPVWIWFVVCISQGLEYTLGKETMTMNWKDNLPPLLLWGLLALSGLLGSGWI